MFESLKVFPKHQQGVFILFVTISWPIRPFVDTIHLTSLMKNNNSSLTVGNWMIFYGGEIYCTYVYIAGQRQMISKCLCCFPFRSPNSRYCCSISHHSSLMCRMKGFWKLKARTGRENALLLFFERGGAVGPPEGRAGRVVLLKSDAALGPYDFWSLGLYAFQP